ncbi:MAG TPA: isoprenylcysteine carboxylmethyltransferase family protein [Bryobacteraceae bacterium]|nr:isoprenylcysteine carboxylmethyltransferase family protein [Bryobacteraceae bacterium]
MYPGLSWWIEGFWIAFLAIWLLAAIRTKRVVRRQSGRSRFLQGGLAAAGAILLFEPGMNIGFLGLRIVPDTARFTYAGVVLTGAGIAFAVWARFVLGQNWSGRVTVKQNHELIRRGPYALVRHPIYSGLLLALLGTAGYLGEVRGFIAVALIAISFSLKYRTEETFMLEQFGVQYRDYRRHVKALIPHIL